jgi:hypothetical protein
MPEQKKPDKLDSAYDGLERDTPDRVSRAIRWLRDPAHRRVRLPIGIVLIITGFFGFLPVIGFEFIPLGMLLIAQDIPVLREPVGRFTLWLEEKWHHVRDKWRRWRQGS